MPQPFRNLGTVNAPGLGLSDPDGNFSNVGSDSGIIADKSGGFFSNISFGDDPLDYASNSVQQSIHGCPPRTTYSGRLHKYTCEAVVLDDNGHKVWIRQGDGSFGYSHFYDDHNLELHTAIDVIERFVGIPPRQSNGRYLYGAEYQDDPFGPILAIVKIFEERKPNHDIPDKQELGVVTGYCQGIDGVYEPRCPDWINLSL